MINMKCQSCGKRFYCNGDENCRVKDFSKSGSPCFCKKCSEAKFANKGYGCVYSSELKEKVEFT